MEDWKTWRPKNDYEFYMFQICKLYIAGIISTKECNRRIEKLKTIYKTGTDIQKTAKVQTDLPQG